MDRRVPSTGSEEIDLYIRTYYSLLRSSMEVRIRTLEEVHASMGSALHPNARSTELDLSAFVYSGLRLPGCITEVDRVVLGQGRDLFQTGQYNIGTWQKVSAKARRRMTYYNGSDTLAFFIGSRSDIDDIIPMLTAFQIEWNKLHELLRGDQVRVFLENPEDNEDGLAALALGIGLPLEFLFRLRQVWEDRFWELLRMISRTRKNFKVRLLSGSYKEYRRATQSWWHRAEEKAPAFRDQPVYIISSNPHSLFNLLTGFALRHEKELTVYLDQQGDTNLRDEWENIQNEQVRSSRENFLYYVLKKYSSTAEGAGLLDGIRSDEKEIGLIRVPSEFSFDVEIQLSALKQLRREWLDPRLCLPGIERLANSDALLVNIDYPLGFSAYQILSYISTRVGQIRGVYIMGKAATLNGVIGDVIVPSLVHDEHSRNTYLFNNVFSAPEVAEYLHYGTVLDNQKAVSVRGTFLQTPRYMDVFYQEGYTDIEMEAGPYLSAICEMVRPNRYPENELVDLHDLPFDFGILHYASDTPLSKGLNLGAASLSYYGMDPTYAASVAVLRRIIEVELRRL
ncbi:MAG: hypothetical protein JXA25_14265 [Anaerolineales bacterium]|nr:hypothetical protein [Anaerolineales bacterium]